MARWSTCILILASACSRASDEGEAKQWAATPPGKDVPPSATLRIEVLIDGTQRAAITAETLHSVKPDFTDDERTAWLIPTLIAEAAPPGTIVEAVSPVGVSLKFSHPAHEGMEPVLFLTRRGEVIVSAVDPKDPFPRYHGQGGRLHRIGDSLPRIGPVARLEITHTKP